MNIPEEYSLAGQPWETKEDQQLIKEYTVDKLTVMQLCNIHKRKPGGIISRLHALKLIDKRDNAHGYLEYKQSDLYKEICRNKKDNRIIRKENKMISEKNIITEVVNSEIDVLEITLLKKDINELKKDVKEILRLMNALYDFEASQN